MKSTITPHLLIFNSPIILNPFDSRSKGWSIFKEVEHELEFDTIAEALVGSDDKKHGEFWSLGAKTIMSELMKKAYRDKKFSMKDLIKDLFSIKVSDLHKLLKGTSAHKLTSPENKETTLGLLATLSAYVRSLQYVKEEDSFSISDWVNDKSTSGCIFLTSVSTIHSSIAPLISMMLNVAVSSLMSTKKNTGRKTWFIFDELSSLNTLPSLEQGLTVTRNYGGCFLIGIQSISQLYEKYGHNITETISSNCKTKVILNAADSKTARWCADTIGSQEVEMANEGLSYGADKRRDGVNIAKNYREKNLVLPSEILALPNLSGYLIMSGGYPIAKIKYEYQNWPVLQESIVKKFEDITYEKNSTDANSKVSEES